MATQKRRKPVRMPGAATPLVNPKTGALNQQLHSTLNNLAAGTQDQFYDTIYNWCIPVDYTTGTGSGGVYNNGVDGVGATLTYASAGNAGIDFPIGKSYEVGKRVLVKGGNAPGNNRVNGLYDITFYDGNQLILTRSSDYDQHNNLPQINQGDLVYVKSGQVNSKSFWAQTEFNSESILGTDDILFIQINPAEVLNAILPLHTNPDDYLALPGKIFVSQIGPNGEFYVWLNTTGGSNWQRIYPPLTTYGTGSPVGTVVSPETSFYYDTSTSPSTVYTSIWDEEQSSHSGEQWIQLNNEIIDLNNTTGTLLEANGGTGETTYTDGQLLIGNSSDNGLTKATLTAGTGISITNGNGSITIANTASSGDWVKIGATTASNSTAITFTGLSSTYAAYKLVMSHVKPVTDAVNLWIRTSTNNGSSYDSGATNYVYGNAFVSSGAVASQTGSTGAAQLVVGGQIGNATGEQYHGEVMLYNPSAADFGSLSWNTWAINSAGSFNAVFGGGYRNSAAAVNAIQILMSSGNISSGIFTLYGLKA